MNNLKSIALNILNETPDYVYVRGSKKGLEYTDRDAYTFGYRFEFKPENFKMENKSTHWDIFHTERVPYSGRLWKNSKLITFWSYPETTEILRQIIKDINMYALEHKMMLTVTSSWRIEEVVERLTGKVITPFNRDNYPIDIIKISQNMRYGNYYSLTTNPEYRHSEYRLEVVPINDYLKPFKGEWE
jgi:hypothetical protein